MDMHPPDVFHARPRLLTRQEYLRIGETGIFDEERVELIRGVVIRMPPIGPPHANSVDELTEKLVTALHGRARVRIQHPFVAADESMPQPDVAIVPVDDYSKRHPDRAFLLIEVSESSLRYDRETKAPLYAESAVDEYWLVDVASGRVEVFRGSKNGEWTERRTVPFDGELTPLAFPDVSIDVRDLVKGGAL